MILLDSLIWLSSLQIFENSLDGIVTTDAYSVSGIPNYSESRDIRLRVNSDTLSPSKLSILIIGYFWLQRWTARLLVLRLMSSTWWSRKLRKWIYIIISCAFEDLAQILDAETHGKVAIATVPLETSLVKLKSNQCYVWWVHGLEGDASAVHIKVNVLNEFFDGIDDLFENHSFLKTRFKHFFKLIALDHADRETYKWNFGAKRKIELDAKSIHLSFRYNFLDYSNHFYILLILQLIVKNDLMNTPKHI